MAEKPNFETPELTWAGKRAAIAEAGKPVRKTLRPCVEESRNWDTTENLYIEGDNLDVLKLLQESYLSKIKKIYIDPPYNTGSDSFVYSDRFRMSDWCSMMYPRLALARNLLRNDGVIFISIGDNQVHDLRKICGEIFGEDNFVSLVTRIAKRTSNKGTHFRPTKDYILVFAKSIARLPAFGIAKNINEKDYDMTEHDGRKYKKSGASLYQPSLDSRPNQRYYIEAPDGSLIIPLGTVFPAKKADGEKVTPGSNADKVWRWSVETYLRQKHLLIFTRGSAQNPLLNEHGRQSDWNIYPKVYLDEDREGALHPEDIIYDFPNSKGTKELKALGIPFSFAKPSALIKYLAEICGVKDGDIVLDFFSGSATTADAVMQLNAEDGGRRKFIMVQIPELVDHAAFSNICEIGKERIRRAGDKVVSDQWLVTGDKVVSDQWLVIGEEHKNTNHCPLTTIHCPDIGFRVLKLDDTNTDTGAPTPPAPQTSPAWWGCRA